MKKNISFLVFLLIIFSNGVSYAQPLVKSKAYALMLKGLLSHTVPELSVDSAKAISDSATIWLDAREENETQVSGINSATPVGYDKFNIKTLDGISKNSKIIVYCSVGYRSEKVAEKLIKAGFTDVSNLYGGIFEWVNAGNKTYINKIITPKIHAYNKVWGAWVNKGEKVYPK
jgi:rhodanese-related sulfurtransferase